MLSTLTTYKTHFAMGTVMSHKIFGMYAEDCLDAIIREISRLEKLFSRFIPESDVNKINQSAGGNPLAVNPDTCNIITRSKDFSAYTQGNFDITIAPLVALWNIGREPFATPSKLNIQRALALVNYHDLILNSEDQKVGLKKNGQSIDLGGVGKGYAADSIREIYRLFGIQSACSNLGGNVIAIGSKPDGSPWHVGIQHPLKENCLLGSIPVVNQSVVTSGGYQRFSVDQQGNRCNHILNPITGYPVKSNLMSVTILSEDSLAADALSTALFVMGFKAGAEILKNRPGIEAILMDGEGQVFISCGLENKFQPAEGVHIKLIE